MPGIFSYFKKKALFKQKPSNSLTAANPCPKKNSHGGKRSITGLGLCLMLASSPAYAQAPLPIMLKETAVSDFAAVPPASDPKLKPNFKEKSFALKEAYNYEEVMSLIGGLNPEQEAYLEKNRFILLPKPKLLTFSPQEQAPADEMLANFDGIGGSLSESDRAPQNARFIGPDVFLHAFDRYLTLRLEALEAGPQYDSVKFMLTGLFENAAYLKSQTSGASAAKWERLMSQLAVPLVLIENGRPAAEEDEGPTDTLPNALKIFNAYQSKFSKSTAADIRKELERVYKAEETAPGLLGLAPVRNSREIDYSVFFPAGHYASNPRLRAYYRAMAWLGELGWSTESKEGLADALNCSLAMSHESRHSVKKSSSKPSTEKAQNETGEISPETKSILEAWSEVMSLNTFFIGYPEALSYLEWLPFLMKEAEVPEFTIDTGADEAVLQRLLAAAKGMEPVPAYFGFLPEPENSRVISVFPRRQTVPRMLSQQMSRKPGLREEMPDRFSALWIPALLGSRYALEAMPRQMSIVLSSLSDTIPEEQLKEVADLKSATVTARMDVLSAKLKAEPESAWFNSIGASWLRLAQTLVFEPDSGYPAYMRSEAFQAKQVETILAALAQRAHDVPSFQQPGSEIKLKAVENDQRPAEPVKGFVEPNLHFWREMIRTVQYTMDGFAARGLFLEDLEESGCLRRFLKRLERCAALAEKELNNEELSKDDYEFLRLFTLDWMAVPYGLKQNVLPLDRIKSAALIELPPFGLNVGKPGRLYQATAEPQLMLALVGNEKSPRLTIGLAYNHYEFIAPFNSRVSLEAWRREVYLHHRGAGTPGKLPSKNIWYGPLRLKRQ